MRGPQRNRTARARDLRTNATSAEEKLWGELRGRRLGGFKFVRQFPVGPTSPTFFAARGASSSRSTVARTASPMRSQRT